MAHDNPNDNAIGYIQLSTNVVNVRVNDEASRILKFSRRKNMLNDNFYELVKKELGNVVTSASETGLIDQIDDTNNLFTMVIEEISRVYDQEPTRTFSEDEKTQEDMTLLYEELKLTRMLKQSNIYMNAFNDVLLQVGYDSDTGKYNLMLRTPDHTIVVHDEFLNPTEVYIFQGMEDGVQTWKGYTAESIFDVLVESANDVKTADRIDEQENPIKVLPFVVIHRGFRDDSFWQVYKGDALVKGNIQVAIKLTFLNQLIKFQSFKQIVATAESGSPKNLNGAIIDPSTVLYLFGEGSKIDTLDLESNYKMLWETIQGINQNIATNYKISPNMFKLTAIPQSGFSLQMENVKLDKFVKDQQADYVGTEKEVFNLLTIIDTALGVGQIKGENPGVIFPEPSYPKSDMEVLNEQEKKVAMGKTSIPKILAEEQGIEEDEAVKQYDDNLASRNKGNQKVTTGTLNIEGTGAALEEANNE